MAEIVANIPISKAGTLGTVSLNGALASAVVTVSGTSPGGSGLLVLDVFQSHDGGVTWDPPFITAQFEADPSWSFSSSLKANTANDKVRVDVRSVTGGTWHVTSVVIDS